MTASIALRAASVSAALLLAAYAVPVQAAGATGTLRLKGNVTQVCTVEVRDMGTDLNLVNGSNTVPVGEVTENCNSGTGYTITLSSQNEGKLTTGTGAQVPYTVNYDGATGGAHGLQVNRDGARFDKKSTLAVNVNGNAQAIAGNYTDTVTITIAAK